MIAAANASTAVAPPARWWREPAETVMVDTVGRATVDVKPEVKSAEPEEVGVAWPVKLLAQLDVATAVKLVPLPPATCWKLAHEIRVLLLKCTTKLRLPKKAPMPSAVDAYSSV